jgi:hypothetical protein
MRIFVIGFTCVLLAALIACSKSAAPSSRPAESPAPVRVTQFYASPPKISKGGRTLLCYGVDGAESVRLEPSAHKIAPSVSRCVEESPLKTTAFTLIAQGKSGASARSEVTVTVGPPAAKIQHVEVSSLETLPGEPVSICAFVENAEEISISPKTSSTGTKNRACFAAFPKETTTYTVKARGLGGDTDFESITVKVRAAPTRAQ